jgi:hypothetical protein
MPLDAWIARNRSTGAKMRFTPLRAATEAPGGTEGFSDGELFGLATQPRRVPARCGGGPTTRFPAVNFFTAPLRAVYAGLPMILSPIGIVG